MPGLVLLLLFVLVLIALLAAYNWSLVLPIVFLGMKTQALPIWLWIGLSIGAGFCTSLLLQFFNYLQNRALVTRFSQRSTEPLRYHQRTETSDRQTSYTPPNQPSNNDDESDWDAASNEDWEFEEETETTPSDRAAAVKDDIPDYEARRTPTSSQTSGSVYSYSYRQPEDASVGKTESVYDVNYRVINPPNWESDRQPEVQEESDDDDDWGFEDDEDFEDFEGDRERDRR
jgi:hypothetical protein